MIDLHTHSTASDGTDAPGSVVAMAATAGLRAVALTDHDTVGGLGEATSAAEGRDVRLVPGCELSCTVDRGTMHVVVLFLEGDRGPLQDRLAELRDGRDDRNDRIVEALQGLGMDVTLDEVEARAQGSVGRPHVAVVLLEKGYVETVQEAFDLFLAKGRPAYVERTRLAPGVAIGLARASGAVTVLAHPLSLDREPDELAALLTELADAGLDGMEVEYGGYTREERDILHSLAIRHRLCPSGGSDYHGEHKPGLAVGSGRGDLAVPDEWLDELEARRPVG